ncbi:MAG: SsrA-binding protein SmpB [Rhodospirillales bacterium]|nr:SsrA-binding protein SmpB [Rhodospirillales bacterium]MBT8001470.1 SsrA-binding protein SmpB [Rhodospirillales bacterium]
MAKKKKAAPSNIAAQNRKARHNYSIEENFEAGIQLFGTEVKSLRLGRGTITEAFAGEKDGALYLFNAFIPPYESAGHFSHEPKRPRKLLMHKREIFTLISAVNREGMTLVPLSIYWNPRGLAKVDLALGKGKQKADKRASIKERDWKRQKARVLRDKG